MLRNKEIAYFLLGFIMIGTLTTTTAAIFFSIQVVWFVVITFSVLLVQYLFYTYYRYDKISQLSSNLRKINSGEYSLDIRDNREGELSILQNEIYKVTLKLAEQNKMLEQEKVKLNNAISDISHQIKTPLTSMMVMADLLGDPKLKEVKRMEFIHNIQSQLERMEWLVSTLLKLAKIDAGVVHFKKEPYQVSELLNKAVESVIIPMDIKNQSLQIDGDSNVMITGDFNWTKEAVINILKNCVEHTGERGTITISFKENTLYTLITIEDNGKGINKKDLPYIFKRFYKGEDGSDDSVGIGLAMAYSIVTNQQGDIEVYSLQGAGTQFHLKFYHAII
ncbi:Signal transduction histidine kinase [Gracilibacillus ureilyticus]|uniref:histidine kinase n=1 Tax=Gracilibacillus ureilyticus TaxID=531814 RepID=A0A1H9UUU3_9BACI|nr:HAMP domain-containing sensor histidine kinase [Gracilibacillus ureilyticus]SES12894.1 Signal transduction histidine kinase [Gracilibacillus ureilyticus]